MTTLAQDLRYALRQLRKSPGYALVATLRPPHASLLDGVAITSPVMAIATLPVLLSVLTLAFVFPAGRAASVDPMEALRDQ